MFRIATRTECAAERDDLIAEGDRLTDENQYDKAIAAFQAALKSARASQDNNGEGAALYGIAGVEELRSNYQSARGARCLPCAA